MSQDKTKWYAKIVERKGKAQIFRVKRTQENADTLEKMGYKPYLGVEENRFPERRTIDFVPVEIQGEILLARVYADQSEADYDTMLEDYLCQVRVERGYTTREPDDYFGSSNPRWSQDAKDWVAFRDAVMTYALGVISTYTKTGNAPTLAEFKAGFPKMVWTYQEEV